MDLNSGRSRAEEIAETMGAIVGAASSCDGVTIDRLSAAVGKIGAVVSVVATDDGDAEVARAKFEAGFDAGKAAVESGRIDPQAAEDAFDTLEETLSA